MRFRYSTTPKARNTTFYVTDEKGSGTEHIVHHKWSGVSHRKVWTCDCRDFTERQIFHGGTCGHIDYMMAQLSMLQSPASLSSASTPRKLTAKSILADIAEFLNPDCSIDSFSGKTTREERDQLWAILSALRGPDTPGSYNLKDETTGRIRYAIGLRSHFNNNFTVSKGLPLGTDAAPTGTIIGEYSSGIPDAVRTKFPSATGHFARHIDMAIRALLALEYIKKP